jgi:hypothetical protein
MVPGFGSLLFEALVRVGVAIFAFASPARAALALRFRQLAEEIAVTS